MGCAVPPATEVGTRPWRVSLVRACYREGWKQPLIVDMLRELDLHAVPVNGCATGLTDKNGIPLFKPWPIAVSSTALVEELKNFRCDKNHEHGKVAGVETAKTA